MKTSCLTRRARTIGALAALITAGAPGLAAQTLQQLNDELALTKLKLELAETKLALAKKEQEVAALAKPTPPEPEAKPKPDSLTTEQKGIKSVAESSLTRRLFQAHTQGVTLLTKKAKSPDTRDAKSSETQDAELQETDDAAQLRNLGALRHLTNEDAFKTNANGLIDKASAPLQRVYTATGAKIERAAKKAKEAQTAAAKPAKPEAEAEGDAGEPDIAKSIGIRDAGFSLGYGAGAIFAPGEDATVGTILLRWNSIQRASTIKWNNTVGTYGPDKRQRITYRGMIGAPLLEDRLGNNASPHEVVDALTFQWWRPTTLGLFIGRGIAGEQVVFRAATPTAAEVKQRPWLIGATFGWGFRDQAASAFTIDIGAAISPTTAFTTPRLYTGISFDLETVGKLFDRVSKGSFTDGK